MTLRLTAARRGEPVIERPKQTPHVAVKTSPAARLDPPGPPRPAGAPRVVWAVGVTTAPRKQGTLARTLQSLADAGWREAYLFADGPVDPPRIERLKLTTIRRNTSSGIYANWLLAALELWLRHPTAQRLLLIQDDTVFCRGVREYLERSPLPKDGLISLYTARGRDAKSDGFHAVAPRLSGMGALAWVFTPAILHALLADKQFLAHRLSKKGHKHIDTAVAHHCIRRRVPQYHHTPSLAQHIGDTSTVGHGSNTGRRRSASFPGEQFDARTLLADLKSQISNLKSPPLPARIPLPPGKTRRSDAGLESWESWLVAHVPARGRVAIDVGANTGAWTASLAKRFARVVAIEPVQAMAAAIGERRLVNVEVHRAAAWSELGEVTLRVRDDQSAIEGADVHEGFAEPKSLVSVPALPLDWMALVEVDFVKIDTEGAEVRVLQGAVETLKRCRPKLVVECHAAAYREEASRLLASLGYRVTIVRHPAYRRGQAAYEHHCWLVAAPAHVPLVATKIPPAKPAPASKGKRPRVGLVGYNTATGLGYQNRGLAAHVADTWFIKGHSTLPTLPVRGAIEDCDLHVCPAKCPQEEGKLKEWLRRIDVLLFCERKVTKSNLLALAKKAGVPIVCVPNHEWLPEGLGGWLKSVDLFLSPTRHTHELLLSRGYRSELVPWPIDVEQFPFRTREKLERFLFVEGRGGVNERKGSLVVARAARLAPEIPLLVYSQLGRRDRWPAHVEVRAARSPAELYREGDALLAPSRVEGLGLQLLEAQAAGLPLITTDAAPMREHNAWRLLPATSTREKFGRIVDAWDVRPEDLAATMRELLGADVAAASQAAREWVEREHGWGVRGPEIEGQLAALAERHAKRAA